MSQALQIQQIELSMDQAKAMVSMRDSLRRLESNRDFKKVITKAYCKEEALRMVGLLGSEAMQDKREQIVEALAGVALLQDFMRTIAVMGDNAEVELAELEEAREEVEAMDDFEAAEL